MIILGVSTSRPPTKKTIKNSISYEIIGEYFVIKVKTRIDPNDYGLFGSHGYRAFSLSFDNREERQIFSKDESGEIISELYVYNIQEERQIFVINESGETITQLQKFNVGEKLLEKSIINEEDFGTFTENGYFLILIRNELLKYENPKLENIWLRGKNGEYRHEIYVE
jgi:hypothetical protein